ncbi:hypothetical protein ACED23_26125 [Vibrio splendidus]
MMRNADLIEAIKFFTPISKSNRVHSNFVFRFSFCGLSDDKAARSVGVDIEQIHKWDDGEDIPFPVRRVWLLESGREIPEYTGFPGWGFRGGRFYTPDGVSYTDRQIRVALFLLDQNP